MKLYKLLDELYTLINKIWETEPLDTNYSSYLQELKLRIIEERDLLQRRLV